METIEPWVIFTVLLALIVGALAGLAARVRRRGAGRDLMGPVDLIYRPHTHQINVDIQAYEQHAIGLPPADDPHRPEGR